jgi:hypothetical protein
MSYQQTLVMPFVMYWTVDSKHMQQFINNTQKNVFQNLVQFLNKAMY